MIGTIDYLQFTMFILALNDKTKVSSMHKIFR